MCISKVIKRMGFNLNYECVDFKDGQIEVYEDVVEGEEYVIGADTAKGLANKDNSSAVVMNKRTYQVVAKYTVNTSPEAFGLGVSCLARYYNNAMIAFEKNDRGYTAILKCIATGYRNLYYDGMELSKSFKEWGWHTNSRTKPIMVDQLTTDFKNRLFDKLPKSLLEEMSTYIQDDKDKFTAIVGKHDDEIIAFSIALLLCYYFPYTYKRKSVNSDSRDYVSKADLQLHKEYVINKSNKSEAKYEYEHGIL